MTIQFKKYQGTGNDFILLDNRNNSFSNLSTEQIEFICNRRFGIGADGLMMIQNKLGFDFQMLYYNADGKPGSMCGNGGRCIIKYAHNLGLINEKANFWAVDGEHLGVYSSQQISLKMSDVNHIEQGDGFYFLNTGSPHYVCFVADIWNIDVVEKGREIRYNSRFAKEGTNVNFINWNNGNLTVRTYERGVEDETFSCGTGVTAAALVASLQGLLGSSTQCNIITKGGALNVKFKKTEYNTFQHVWLEGPAECVFEGNLNI
jgi:diaminopimelate epimerase